MCWKIEAPDEITTTRKYPWMIRSKMSWAAPAEIGTGRVETCAEKSSYRWIGPETKFRKKKT